MARRCVTSRACCARSTMWVGAPVAGPSPGTVARCDHPGWTSTHGCAGRRERFLDAYRTGLREAGAPIDFDPALLRAFEIEKETYEFIYASTYLPSWLWAPTEGMEALLRAT